MIVNIILTIILFILFISAVYNIIVGFKTNDNIFTILSVIQAGLIGMLFSLALSSILFTI